jgi:predicted ATPase/Tfp pilus assembly protein PilF
MDEHRRTLGGFIGRERELESLTSLFANERLVSIVGGPGVGKSRFATTWALRVAPGALGWSGAVVVDLGATQTKEEVSVAVANALRLRDSSPSLGRVESSEVGSRVDAALESAEVELLVLDDADRAIDALGEHLARWIDLAPSVRFLLTTRQAARLSSEHLLELGPLSVPEDDFDGDIVAHVRSSEAASLVLSRAPDLAVDEESAPWIARLVRAVGGNPLAIELAAARLRSLGLRDVIEELERGIELLDRGPRDRSARHASLRSAIDASWQTGTPEERALLARCSVFRGWFDVDAAIEVTEIDRAVVDTLYGARERSLLAMQTVQGRSRYSLSASVRAFAEEKLAQMGEQSEVRVRHAAWLARRAEEAAGRWRVWASNDELAFLREHQGDLADALEAAGTDAVRAQLLLAFDILLLERERPDDHVALLTRASEGDLDPVLAARVHVALALALERAGDSRAGLAEIEKARAIAPDRAADIEVVAAQLSQSSGELEAAERSLQIALERAPKKSPIVVQARRGLALVAHARGKVDVAERAYKDALDLAAQHPLLEARLLSDLGSIRLQQHRLDEARELFGRALERSRGACDPITVGLTEGNLGILTQEQGRLDDAGGHLARAQHELARSGHRLYEAHITVYLGFLEHERGNFDRSIGHYERAHAALIAIGDRRMAGLALAGLGAASAALGRTAAAEEAFAGAHGHLEAIGDEGLLLALELHRAHLVLCEADADPEAAPSLRERVVELTRGASAEILGRSDDARTALRLLRVRLGARSVSIAEDGSLVRLPDGTELDLSRRDVLKRIVVTLARARVDRPNAALTVDTLIEEGWPGERVKYQSALNRLKVALSTLRKLGMKDLIVRREDGYLLDPSIALEWL